MSGDAVPPVLVKAGPTPREREVFWLVAERLRNRAIAERLYISERTVESHVAALLRKLGGSDRTALIALGEDLRQRPGADPGLPKVLSSFVGRDAEVAELSALVLAWHGSGPSHPASCCRTSTTGSHCWEPGPWTARLVTGRSKPRCCGATSCWTRPSSWSSSAARCSRGSSTTTPPSRC